MAAGLGFKTFTSGEVLTAADTNGYLMQGINVFANASARSAAITSPQEGQYSFLKDTNALEYYDGAAWVGAPVGDITAVTAGKGLTGGGSSGDVTVSLATTAKGDLVAGSGASTAAVLTVGSNGETLVADSSTSSGLRWQGNYAAGKNVIINGDFSNWQRSTSATVTSENYLAPDRFRSVYVAGGATTTWSRQTFTPGAAPVAGYEGQYFSRIAATSGGASTVIGIGQKVENVQTFAGQTATVSFWAKTDSARTGTIYLVQNFGVGGSTEVGVGGSTPAFTTSWTRYSLTVAMPSITGKTIGTSSYIQAFLYLNTGQASGSPQLDIWGVQWELGSVATAFQTATGTIQGELAACQRYYYRQTGDNLYANFGLGTTSSTTIARISVVPPVSMRVKPSSVDYSTLALYDGGSRFTVTALSINTDFSGATQPVVDATSSGMTAVRPTFIQGNGSASAYLGFSAEL